MTSTDIPRPSAVPAAGAAREAAPAHLFSPLAVRGSTLRNRIVVSPMCQYSCDRGDGMATDWHFVHLGTRAVGGAGLVFTEANAVSPEGRISPQDLGIWSDAHVGPLARIVEFVHAHGAAAGTQLAHAGRKASTPRPWEGGTRVPESGGGWEPVAPSPVAFADGYAVPRELTVAEIEAVQGQFAAAAGRARSAGFDWIEVHAAHGYLLHEFLSPLSNRRTDAYGGTWENRARMVLETVRAVRAAWAGPLAVRISATDWVPDGWTERDSVRLAPLLIAAGADLIDCSSGGNVARAEIPVRPGYQVRFAQALRETGALTGAVGMITEPAQADGIIRSGQADVVLLARALLRDRYWPLLAGRALGQAGPVPAQYQRAYR